MANEILDNRGRGEAAWQWPRIHPEAHKFAAIAGVASATAAFFAWETLAWPLAFLVLGPVVDLKLLGLFGVVLQPKAIALTAAGAGVAVLLLGQWVNLMQL